MRCEDINVLHVCQRGNDKLGQVSKIRATGPSADGRIGLTTDVIIQSRETVKQLWGRRNYNTQHAVNRLVRFEQVVAKSISKRSVLKGAEFTQCLH